MNVNLNQSWWLCCPPNNVEREIGKQETGTGGIKQDAGDLDCINLVPNRSMNTSILYSNTGYPGGH